MPLIPCPDCGTEVSDQAHTCVKCGRPIRPPRAKAPIIVGVGGLHAVLDGNEEVTARDIGGMLKFVLSVALLVIGGVGLLVFGGVSLMAEEGLHSAMLVVLAFFGLVTYLGVRLFQSLRRSG